MFKYHPDRNASPDCHGKMKLFNEAYEVLSDPESRRQYDAEWACERPAGSHDLALKMVELGDALLERGEYAPAVVQFGQAIELLRAEDHNATYGVLARAYNNRGIAYARLDLFDEAAADFEGAYALVPGDDCFLGNVRRARAEKEQRQQAEDEWKTEEVRHSERTSCATYYDPNRPTCPKCQAPMALQMGPRGPFFSCLCPERTDGQDTAARAWETEFAARQEEEFASGIAPSDSPSREQEQEEVPPNFDALFGALFWVVAGMASVGAFGAPAAEYEILGIGIPSAPTLGAILGVLLGVGLAATMSCSERRGAISCLWSALVQGLILGVAEGALAGILSAAFVGAEPSWSGGLWGACSGLALGVVFGAVQLFATRAFWRNANLSLHVLIGGIGIGFVTLLSGIIIPEQSPELFGLSAEAVLAATSGALFGAMMGTAIRVRKPTWWILMIGSVCGMLGGYLSGTILMLTESIAAGGLLGVPIGTFCFATHESIIRELTAGPRR